MTTVHCFYCWERKFLYYCQTTTDSLRRP